MINVSPDGTIQFIYSDDLRSLAAEGRSRQPRQSKGSSRAKGAEREEDEHGLPPFQEVGSRNQESLHQ